MANSGLHAVAAVGMPSKLSAESKAFQGQRQKATSRPMACDPGYKGIGH